MIRPINQPPSKQCGECMAVLPLTSFYLKRVCKDGSERFDSICKPCKIKRSHNHTCVTCGEWASRKGRPCRKCRDLLVGQPRKLLGIERRPRSASERIVVSDPWHRAANRELARLRSRVKCSLNSVWERRCLSAITSLSIRHRYYNGSGPYRAFKRVDLWSKACTNQRRALKGIIIRANATKWKSKCTNAARNWRRRYYLITKPQQSMPN